MQDLPVQIGELRGIRIADPKLPDARDGQVDCRRGSQATGAMLRSLLGPAAWITLVPAARANDSLSALEAALADLLGSCDAVVATGGVSMGNRDLVPAAVRRVGGQTMFHKLRQKPGKPMLGAVGPAGQAVLGLPGSPVSVMVTARRFAYAVLRRLAGFSATCPPTPWVMLRDPDHERLDLWWHRPVRLTSKGPRTAPPATGWIRQSLRARKTSYVAAAACEPASFPAAR